MKPRKPLTWGLIGGSDIAATRMIPAIHRVGGTIAAVSSGSADHAKTYAQRNGIAKHYEGAGRLLEDASIDAVYISSRNELHCEHVIAAAVAGKHVLCEKPVATSLKDAREMIAACHANNVVLAVNHHLPAAGTHTEIRRLVSAGAIGRPLSINIRHSTLLPERLRGWRLRDGPGAGVIMDLSCHNASVVNPLLSARPLNVVATALAQAGWSSTAADASSATIHYDGGILVDFQDSFTLPFATSYIQVNGDQGSILGLDIMTPEPKGSVVLTDRDGQREIDVLDRRHSYDITLEHFRSAIDDSSRPVVDGIDAMNSLAISLAIVEAARTGQRCPVEYSNR